MTRDEKLDCPFLPEVQRQRLNEYKSGRYLDIDRRKPSDIFQIFDDLCGVNTFQGFKH